jgi:hypothetical protein
MQDRGGWPKQAEMMAKDRSFHIANTNHRMDVKRLRREKQQKVHNRQTCASSSEEDCLDEEQQNIPGHSDSRIQDSGADCYELPGTAAVDEERSVWSADVLRFSA